jgi:hypothetical protein
MSKIKVFSLVILNLFIRSAIASDEVGAAASSVASAELFSVTVSVPDTNVPAINKELLSRFGNEILGKPLDQDGIEGTSVLAPMPSGVRASFPVAEVLVIGTALRDERKSDGTLVNTREHSHYSYDSLIFEARGTDHSSLPEDDESRLRYCAKCALIPEMYHALKTQVDFLLSNYGKYSDPVSAGISEAAKSASRKARRNLNKKDLGAESE